MTTPDRPKFASMQEAATYWANRALERPITEVQRDRLTSLLLDEDGDARD